MLDTLLQTFHRLCDIGGTLFTGVNVVRNICGRICKSFILSITGATTKSSPHDRRTAPSTLLLF